MATIPRSITDPKSITQSFVKWLEEQGVATFGQDIFINSVPDSKNTQSSIYWIVTFGGNTISKGITGEKVQLFVMNLYYRDKKGSRVDEKLYELSELLNDPTCFNLDGVDVLEVSVSQFPASQDFDGEDRKFGMLRIDIQTYKKRSDINHGIS